MADLIDREVLKERFRLRINWLKKDVHDQYSLGLYHGCETDAALVDEVSTFDPESLRPTGGVDKRGGEITTGARSGLRECDFAHG